MVVLHTAVGSSRMAALEELLRVCCKTYGVNQMDVVGTESCTRAVDAPTNSLGHCANTTIACYQRMLAEQRGFSHVVHEYDAASDTLTVKGFPKNGSNSSGDSPVVIRVVALKKRFPLIFSIHRYYRTELGLPDIPRRWDEGRMRILSIREIYKECDSHFSSPLPPEGDALTATHGKSGWTITLRLPSSLFELQTPKHLEFTHFSAGKHDGRRDVMCLFYRALHGTLNAQLMVDPPRPAGCGFKENANSTRTSAEGKLALPQARINSTKHDNMYNTLQQLIKTSLKSHVGYEGRVECRLSYMSGITFKYISLASPESELVDLFHGYFHVDEWLPFQLLSALMSCARRLLTAPELEASLLDRSVTWPSLFLEGSSGERLFCTTFLRRYFGFHVYDADDVDELPSAPGTLYLVERTRSVTRGRGIVQFEATLALLQAPHPPATSAFTKILSSHCNVTASRAQAGMWSQVSQRLVRQQAINTARAVDEAVIATVGAVFPNANIG
uniref:WGS project CAEQ00000000 data, annotated contig 105 n=1 Tax=Trypanosoma congolense (strain IL3000) TaxID=1068625 RepID=F9W3I5_TRYCI|nr:unnamed protein product [Trypanosoma congolense IL3000]